MGVADGRPDAVTAGIRNALGAPGTRASLSVSEADALAAMADALPRLLAAIGERRVGNPALHVRVFVERVTDPAQRERARSRWAQAWRRRVPGCEPERAYHRHDPVAHLRAAPAVSR